MVGFRNVNVAPRAQGASPNGRVFYEISQHVAGRGHFDLHGIHHGLHGFRRATLEARDRDREPDNHCADLAGDDATDKLDANFHAQQHDYDDGGGHSATFLQHEFCIEQQFRLQRRLGR
jgi:hypothetical protein